MNTTPEKQETVVTIDATGRSIGRVATEAAEVLRGKNTADFSKNRIAGAPVHITNASQVNISSQRKMLGKVYVRYSGYPGGQKKETLKEVAEKKGYSEAVRRAIYGMLPGNKLRPRIMKRLTISE